MEWNGCTSTEIERVWGKWLRESTGVDRDCTGGVSNRWAEKIYRFLPLAERDFTFATQSVGSCSSFSCLTSVCVSLYCSTISTCEKTYIIYLYIQMPWHHKHWGPAGAN